MLPAQGASTGGLPTVALLFCVVAHILIIGVGSVPAANVRGVHHKSKSNHFFDGGHVPNWLDYESSECVDRSAKLAHEECVGWHMFFDTLGGDDWERFSEQRNDPCACDYNGKKGVTCDSDGKHITVIKLDSNDLRGKITHLNRFPKLQRVNLAYNDLIGELPDLTALTNLYRLELSVNKISGPLPASLNNLPSLRYIKLDNNELAGTIPDLSGLTALTGLELFSNKLNGTVPDTIARFPKLQKLEISNNYLEGRLPDMSRMTKLKMLYAGKNLLGYKMPVPKWLGKLKLLTGLDLWDNKFTSLPDLPFAQYVDWCDFSGNAFSCPVPEDANDFCQAESVPCTPQLVGVPKAGWANVSVAFKPLARDGVVCAETGFTKIRNYTVISWPEGKVGVGTKSPVVVPGLTPDQSYSFTVIAYNMNGGSEASGRSMAVVPLEIPFHTPLMMRKGFWVLAVLLNGLAVMSLVVFWRYQNMPVGGSKVHSWDLEIKGKKDGADYAPVEQTEDDIVDLELEEGTAGAAGGGEGHEDEEV
eukprot:g1366.t1